MLCMHNRRDERQWFAGRPVDGGTGREFSRAFVRSCSACQKANPSNKPAAATLNPIPIKSLFQRWGIDLVRLLCATKRGNKYTTVATEYLTCWTETQWWLDACLWQEREKKAEKVWQKNLFVHFVMGSCLFYIFNHVKLGGCRVWNHTTLSYFKIIKQYLAFVRQYEERI